MNKSHNIILIPEVDGDWWPIAGNPDLGRYNRAEQQPLDFAIWQAADGTWQMVACCRRTGCGGKGRLFHRWQSRSLLHENWSPMGIFMQADPEFGEIPGGLQAPNVIRHDGEFFLFYGDWVNICSARGSDGKSFSRVLGTDGQSRVFPPDETTSSRDPHVMEYQGKFYLYYTGIIGDKGLIFCRSSDNLRDWKNPVIVNSGGSSGSGPSDAECPFVIFHQDQQLFYLFRTHTVNSGERYATSVYCSSDPMNFGVDNDDFMIAALPEEAVRLVQHDGQTYIAALKPDLNGMMMARLKWVGR
jgi:hypothetical protein